MGEMGRQIYCNAGRARQCRGLAERVVVDSPFIRSTSWRVPPLYEPWIGKLFVNYSTSDSERFRFFRLPESHMHLAFFIGPGRAELQIAGAQLKLWSVPFPVYDATPFPVHEVIALELRSGAAQSLLGRPTSEVANEIIAADAIWGRWAREVTERVALEVTTELRIHRLLDLLRVRLTSSPDTVTERIVALAASGGVARVRDLAHASGY